MKGLQNVDDVAYVFGVSRWTVYKIWQNKLYSE
jgi:hypothetical protein